MERMRWKDVREVEVDRPFNGKRHNTMHSGRVILRIISPVILLKSVIIVKCKYVRNLYYMPDTFLWCLHISTCLVLTKNNNKNYEVDIIIVFF